MRNYATDSPKAVCRLLTLAMIVDGHLAPAEVRAMRHSGILRRVGVDEAAFDEVVHEVCEDMLDAAAHRSASEVEIDSRLLDTLLQEVADPTLRIAVMQAMLDIVQADRVLDGRETLLIERSFKAWGTPYQQSARAVRAGPSAGAHAA